MASPLFSPSGLSAIELCPRKFAFDKVDKIPRESNPYAQFGIATHKVIESYYLHGMMPDLADPHGNAAAALLAHLPPPQPGIRVEEHRIVGRFHGYPDLTLGNRVWDHKTTSDHKWALTDLATDLQAAIYAVFALQETGEKRVTLQWNYVTRKHPRVLPVVQTVTLEDIQPTLERAHRLAEIGEDILEHRRPALSLKPNPEACEAYGGCQHRERCALSPAERMTAYQDRYRTEEPDDMTTPQDFMSKMNASHPPTPGAPPAPPGNPWDGLPDDHITPTKWYNRHKPGGADWVEKYPEPPPPPAAVAPPSPPPPPIPINPPPVAASPVVAPPAPPPPVVGTAQTGPALNGDRFVESLIAAGAPESPHERLAAALEAAADAVRELAGKRGPGRPRKAK